MEGLTEILRTKYSLGRFPAYSSKYCLNSVAGGPRCFACNRVCPEKINIASTSVRNKLDSCIKCGICSAVCPSSGIVPLDSMTRSFLMAMGKKDTISVGCERDADAWSLTLPCVAALSSEQICIAALLRGVVLSLKKCEDCQFKECKKEIDNTLKRVKKFLGEDTFFEKVTILREGDDYTPTGEGYSRREIFGMFKSFPLDVAVGLLPEMGEKDYAGFFYRAVLRDVIKGMYDEAEPQDRIKYYVSLPKFENDCYGCGICAGRCPTKALKIAKSSDRQSFFVAVDVWKCSGCGACVAGCREKYITGIATMAVKHIGTNVLKKLPSSDCVVCGKPCQRTSEGGLCPACSRKKSVAQKKAAKEQSD